MAAPEPATTTDDAARDRAWLAAVACGERAAFRALYECYAPRLFRYVLRLIRDTAQAEELINEVMLAVWKQAGQFRGDSKPSTWIFGIAHYAALAALRRAGRAPVALDEAEDESGDPQAWPEVRFAARERETRVRAALARLSPERRAVVELTFYHGFNYPEIAAMLGCPVNTVKTRMFYARQQLHAWLAAANGDHP